MLFSLLHPFPKSSRLHLPLLQIASLWNHLLSKCNRPFASPPMHLCIRELQSSPMFRLIKAGSERARFLCQHNRTSEVGALIAPHLAHAGYYRGVESFRDVLDALLHAHTNPSAQTSGYIFPSPGTLSAPHASMMNLHPLGPRNSDKTIDPWVLAYLAYALPGIKNRNLAEQPSTASPRASSQQNAVPLTSPLLPPAVLLPTRTLTWSQVLAFWRGQEIKLDLDPKQVSPQESAGSSRRPVDLIRTDGKSDRPLLEALLPMGQGNDLLNIEPGEFDLLQNELDATTLPSEFHTIDSSEALTWMVQWIMEGSDPFMAIDSKKHSSTAVASRLSYAEPHQDRSTIWVGSKRFEHPTADIDLSAPPTQRAGPTTIPKRNNTTGLYGAGVQEGNAMDGESSDALAAWMGPMDIAQSLLETPADKEHGTTSSPPQPPPFTPFRVPDAASRKRVHRPVREVGVRLLTIPGWTEIGTGDDEDQWKSGEKLDLLQHVGADQYASDIPNKQQQQQQLLSPQSETAGVLKNIPTVSSHSGELSTPARHGCPFHTSNAFSSLRTGCEDYHYSSSLSSARHNNSSHSHRPTSLSLGHANHGHHGHPPHHAHHTPLPGHGGDHSPLPTQGSCVHHKLSYIVLSTREKIFKIDVIALSGAQQRVTRTSLASVSGDKHTGHQERDSHVSVSSLLQPLIPIFTNPVIVKVFHDGGHDQQWLLKEAGIACVNVFDTYLALDEIFTQLVREFYTLESMELPQSPRSEADSAHSSPREGRSDTSPRQNLQLSPLSTPLPISTSTPLSVPISTPSPAPPSFPSSFAPSLALQSTPSATLSLPHSTFASDALPTHEWIDNSPLQHQSALAHPREIVRTNILLGRHTSALLVLLWKRRADRLLRWKTLDELRKERYLLYKYHLQCGFKDLYDANTTISTLTPSPVRSVSPNTTSSSLHTTISSPLKDATSLYSSPVPSPITIRTESSIAHEEMDTNALKLIPERITEALLMLQSFSTFVDTFSESKYSSTQTAPKIHATQQLAQNPPSSSPSLPNASTIYPPKPWILDEEDLCSCHSSYVHPSSNPYPPWSHHYATPLNNPYILPPPARIAKPQNVNLPIMGDPLPPICASSIPQRYLWSTRPIPAAVWNRLLYDATWQLYIADILWTFLLLLSGGRELGLFTNLPESNAQQQTKMNQIFVSQNANVTNTDDLRSATPLSTAPAAVRTKLSAEAAGQESTQHPLHTLVTFLAGFFPSPMSKSEPRNSPILPAPTPTGSLATATSSTAALTPLPFLSLRPASPSPSLPQTALQKSNYDSDSPLFALLKETPHVRMKNRFGLIPVYWAEQLVALAPDTLASAARILSSPTTPSSIIRSTGTQSGGDFFHASTQKQRWQLRQALTLISPLSADLSSISHTSSITNEPNAAQLTTASALVATWSPEEVVGLTNDIGPLEEKKPVATSASSLLSPLMNRKSMLTGTISIPGLAPKAPLTTASRSNDSTTTDSGPGLAPPTPIISSPSNVMSLPVATPATNSSSSPLDLAALRSLRSKYQLKTPISTATTAISPNNASPSFHPKVGKPAQGSTPLSESDPRECMPVPGVWESYESTASRAFIRSQLTALRPPPFDAYHGGVAKHPLPLAPWYYLCRHCNQRAGHYFHDCPKQYDHP